MIPNWWLRIARYKRPRGRGLLRRRRSGLTLEPLEPRRLLCAGPDGTYAALSAPEPASFTSAESGEIHGSVFDDLDGDGARDTGEPGIANWTIFLDDDEDGDLDGTELAAVTDSVGAYSFTGLANGIYVVAEVLPDGWVQTAPAARTYRVSIGLVVTAPTDFVTSASVVSDLDFGNFRLGEIRGEIFNDLDGDGERAGDEPGLAGWTVFLNHTLNGRLSPDELTATTDATGNYSFTDLGPGTYIVRQALPPGWTQTAPGEGHAGFAASGASGADPTFAASTPTTLIDNGPSSNRIDVVFLGDGYTADQLPAYATHVDSILSGFFAESPLNEYSTFFNVHRVDVASNESGIDNDPQGTQRDTAFDMGFGCNPLCFNGATVQAEAATARDVDQILLLGNTATFGGIGLVGGDVAALTAAHGNVRQLALHEFGHSFADLLDEYGAGPAYGGSELPNANVSIYDEATMASLETKWHLWLDEPGVGTYEGAATYGSGIYRPTANSKMRSIGDPYGPVNSEQFVFSMYRTVRPIDGATPSGVYEQNTVFSVDPIDPVTHSLDVQWLLDGNAIPGAIANTFDASTLDLSSGVYSLEVEVVDNTSLVRDEELRTRLMTQRWAWTVVASDIGWYALPLQSGQVIWDVSFGDRREDGGTSEIRGTVFNDANLDDTRQPSEPLLADWTVYLDRDGDGKLNAGDDDTVTDAAGAYAFTGLGLGDYTVRVVVQPGWTQTTPDSGFHPVTITSDGSVFSRDFGLADATAPVLADLPMNQSVEATSAAGAVATYTLPSASDEVDATPTISCSPPSGATFALGTTTVTCTATDDAGNSSTATFTITVSDTTAPTFTGLPMDQVLEATAAAGAAFSYTMPVASDAVDSNPIVVCTPVSGSTIPLGATAVQCTATDDAGNSRVGAFQVEVRDTTPPSFTVSPPDRVIEATSAAGAPLTDAPPAASDIVDSDPTVTCTPNSGTVFPLGTTTVTCTASDDAGNSRVTAFTVTVRDTIAPELIGVPENQDVQATIAAGVSVTYTNPSAADAVDSTLTVSCSPASGSIFPIGTTTVTCNVRDDAGNSNSADFAVTVRDAVARTIVNLRLNGGKKITNIVLGFSEALDPRRAADTSNYALRNLTDSGLPRGRPVAVRSVVYDAETRSLIVTPQRPLRRNRLFDFEAAEIGGSGATYGAVIGRGTKLTYADRDGDSVFLKVNNNGEMSLLRRPGADAELRLSLNGTRPAVLTGNVTRRLGGDGLTTIDLIDPPDGLVIDLPLSFQVRNL